MKLLLNWIASAVSLLIVARLVPGFIVAGFGAALLAAVVIGFVNATIGLVAKVLTLPITILTLGIFWFVINAFMLMMASAVVPGFRVTGFLPAFLGSIVLSVVNMVMHGLVKAMTKEPRNQ